MTPDLERVTQHLGMNRRDFMKFCTGVAATMGLSGGAAVKMAHAVANPQRPPVIWLSGQQCTGCTETLLRSHHPTLETLILDMISLDYNETLSTPAGNLAEEARHASMKENWGKYLLIVDGSIPTRDGGVYCKIAGRTIAEHVAEAAEGAVAVISMGSCAAWGGIPSSDPNPTEARSVQELIQGKTSIQPANLAAISGKPIINIPGCPPNPHNVLSVALHFVTFGTLPELDEQNRPKFAYGRLIHENCERRPHFDAGRFAIEFGDEGHRQGWCLYKLGCKGPMTHANCPAIEFGDVGGGAWPIGVGAPCFGCTEKGVGFSMPIHSLADVKTHSPANPFPDVNEPVGDGASAGAAALLGAVGGAIIGGGVMASRKLAQADAADDSQSHE